MGAQPVISGWRETLVCVRDVDAWVRLYLEIGEWELRYEGVVDPGSVQAPFQVDALTGATVTGNAVTGLVRYWFGPHGYKNLVEHMKEHPSVRTEAES